MRVQRQMSITVPVPQNLPASAALAYIQTADPIIRNLGTLSRFEPTAVTEDAANDPFFELHPPSPVAGYQIFEVITLAPGLTKEVTYPAFFQRISEGIRVRASGAAGITGWCEFTIRQRQVADSPGSSISTPSTATPVADLGPEEFELYETLVVEANSLLMPFVVMVIEQAHRGLFPRVGIEEESSGGDNHG
ncbi:unnamed protein product [Clonostachys chloroleuca]|uniref:DUF7053 domain-containing protein n=1 Tax=Clonostachys chloroleuca TaxID=1926264 RepID=A0AA35QDN8_9HYPO|nr:unnamed protein product [Clonostachys chloroleuca]